MVKSFVPAINIRYLQLLIMEGKTPLSLHVHAEQDEGNGSLQVSILNTNGAVEMENDPADSDSEINSSDHQPLIEQIDAVGPNAEMEDLSTRASDVSDNFDRALALRLLNRANRIGYATDFKAPLGAFTFKCIDYAAELQQLLCKSIPPHNPLTRAEG